MVAPRLPWHGLEPSVGFRDAAATLTRAALTRLAEDALREASREPEDPTNDDDHNDPTTKSPASRPSSYSSGQAVARTSPWEYAIGIGLLLVLVLLSASLVTLLSRWRRLRFLGLGRQEHHHGQRKPWPLQVATLLRRKELALKRTRRCTTFLELALPVLIIVGLVVASALSVVRTRPATSYKPWLNSSALRN